MKIFVILIIICFLVSCQKHQILPVRQGYSVDDTQQICRSYNDNQLNISIVPIGRKPVGSNCQVPTIEIEASQPESSIKTPQGSQSPATTNFQNKKGTQVYFSRLPVIQINTPNIGRSLDDQSHGMMTIDDGGSLNTLPIKINTRGAFTQLNPKTSFAVYPMAHWKDNSILGLNPNAELALLANYSDPSMMRDTIGNIIYNFLQTERLEQEITKSLFVDLFVNGKYEGVYNFTNVINLTSLNGFGEGDKSLFFRGGNYVETVLPGPTFQKADLEDFENQLKLATQSSQFDLNSFLNFIAMTYLTNGIDQIDNNTYYLIDSHGKVFFIPWDLEFSFGNQIEGMAPGLTSKFLPSSYSSTDLFEYFSNRFPDLHEQIKQDLVTRIYALQESGIISKTILEKYMQLELNLAYEREFIRWPKDRNQPYTLSELSEMLTWQFERIQFVMSYLTSKWP